MESIIFDVDGTLWDSADNVAASWNTAIEEYGLDLTLTGDDIKSVMGMTMDAIADRFFPSLEKEKRTALMDRCTESEDEYLKKHGGVLFEGVADTIKELSRSHRLFIVSNCQKGYIETLLDYSGLGGYITDHLCWGDTGLPKNETILRLMEKNGCTDAVYVGDTQGDCDATAKAGIPFVFAAYGFGEISTPEKVAYSINSISELKEICERSN